MEHGRRCNLVRLTHLADGCLRTHLRTHLAFGDPGERSHYVSTICYLQS